MFELVVDVDYCANFESLSEGIRIRLVGADVPSKNFIQLIYNSMPLFIKHLFIHLFSMLAKFSGACIAFLSSRQGRYRRNRFHGTKFEK